MKITKITKVEPRTVYAISTTTGTFIADGLAHHNCYHCNVGLKGNPRAYDAYMRLNYTPEQILAFDRSAYEVKKYSLQDYLDLRVYYDNKTKQLEEEENEI